MTGKKLSNRKENIWFCSSKAFGWVSFPGSHLHIPAQLALRFSSAAQRPKGL